MPDHEKPNARGLFGGVFARGGVEAGDAAWLQAMLDAEAGLARALERAGLAPAGAGEAVTAAARAGNFDPNELGGLAALTGNPVPGLARALARQVPQTAVSAVHRGATSQDIVDTAAMLLAKRAIDVIAADLARAADTAAGLAAAHRDSIMIGRTLLQQAVPVTFGLVAAGWLTSLDEARAGLDSVSPRLAVQFGGAAGTLASLGEAGQRVTALLATELGLAVPVLPWHTDRLRIIDLGTALARVAAVLGKIARDVTLLAQSEVGEVSEGGGPAEARADQRGADQQAPADSPEHGGVHPPVPPRPPRRGGSSAMPHKRNPVASIAILGCTRQVPGLLATLTAASEQELQRAAGAWHAEWEPLTALLRLTGSASSWAADLLPGLVVDTSRMAANLAATKGLPLAEHVSSLLAGVLGGAQAHDLVAEAGARATSAGLPLRDVLLAVPKLEERLSSAGITAEQIDSALEPSGYLGAAGAFVTAALDAHKAPEARHG
jgi:3-carboxy-cis,cis-muconate cycloisomerase